MKLLAFDTSYSACSVALQDGDTIKVLHEIAPMRQAQMILPMIHEVLASCSLSLNDLDAIAYGCGPGSFTGVRIASSVSQGLGFAAQKPIIQVSSLAAMAQAAYMECSEERVLLALDARMEQVYWAVYAVNEHDSVALTGIEQVCAPGEVTVAGDASWCAVGDGWEKYGEVLQARLGYKPRRVDSSQFRLAQAMLVIAQTKLTRGEIVTASDATPVYLR